MKTDVLIAESFVELQQFLATTIEQSNFKLSQINISDQQEWYLQDGALSHHSGGFFHVTGLKSQSSNEEHLVLFQPQNALTGLALCRRNKSIYVLLQARIEPGNTGIGQYGPTIQSTPANYQKVHRGKTTSYLDLFYTYNAQARPIAHYMQLDLGKRYFQKSKSHIYIEVPELIETKENMIWVSLSIITKTLDQHNFINADLRSLISVLDWDLFLHNRQMYFLSSDQNRFYSALISGNRLGTWELTSITTLMNWKLLDEGIVDISNSGISVSLYQISCTSREVNSWVQPLMKSHSQGLVVLFMRSSGENMEFLVSLDSEYGITGEQSILPSIVIYPGESSTDKRPWIDGVVISEFVQSDEGGRFYQHESVYQLVQTTNNVATTNQYWISIHTLKQLLKTSNSVSFQLRCIASLIVEKLNPLTFSN